MDRLPQKPGEFAAAPRFFGGALVLVRRNTDQFKGLTSRATLTDALGPGSA